MKDPLTDFDWGSVSATVNSLSSTPVEGDRSFTLMRSEGGMSSVWRRVLCGVVAFLLCSAGFQAAAGLPNGRRPDFHPGERPAFPIHRLDP